MDSTAASRCLRCYCTPLVLTKCWYTDGIFQGLTRNALDCDQSNYYSRIVFSRILTEFGPTQIAPFDPPTPKTLP